MGVRPTRRSVLLAAAVVQASWCGAALAQNTTETENFNTAPGDWISAGPTTTDGHDYGFKNTNETGGASGAGEAGGKFHRDNTRGFYGDVTLGGLLTEASTFSASGELFVEGFNNFDSEMVIGYLEKDVAGQPGDDGVGGHDWLGVFIGDNGSGDPTNFALRAIIYDSTAGMVSDRSGRHRSEPIPIALGTAKSYDMKYENRQLTVRVFDSTGAVINQAIATLPADKSFSVDTYGVSHGTTGEPNPALGDISHRVLIDAVTYSRAITGDFDGNQSVQAFDFDLLRAEINMPAGPPDDRMFDINDDTATNLTDRDAILTAINRKLGDTDLDGDVDLNDLGNLASGFGKAPDQTSYGNGDTDLDFDVDLNDLGNLASNFQSGRSAAYAQFEALVPEPTTLSLLAIGAAGMLRRRRRA